MEMVERLGTFIFLRPLTITMKHILLSRTDSIGDVVLTLPMTGVLKEAFPDAKVSFLGRSYTRAVVACCTHVDTFYDWEHLPAEGIEADCIIHVFPRKAISRWAKHQNIPIRIGTSHRPYHWTTCNRWVNLGRKKSDLHEAQLNLQLLRPLLERPVVPLAEVSSYYGWRAPTGPPRAFARLLSDDKFNLIFHPKSQGSAVEWPLDHYIQLARLLPIDQFHIIVTGTKDEGELIQDECPALLSLAHVTSAIGAFSLTEFIDFIADADGLLAGSTGPLHLASASGIRTLGLYSSHRPIHPGRWRPVGKAVEWLSAPDSALSSPDLAVITPEQVYQKLLTWIQ